VNIRAVVFDCDGVILESTDIKTEAFRALFEADQPDRIPEILDYHVRHMGISRHLKLRHICTEILGETCTARREARLAAEFSRLVFARVLQCPIVPGTREFLRGARDRYRCFVASGTPHEELELILRRRRLLGYFERTWGSPAKKPDVLRQVLRRGPFRKGEVAFVGDAESDWRAAKESGVRFVRRVGSPADWRLPPCRWQIRDLRGLPAVIAAMERA
jgi:phosphoglycolate phosphatase-like HAD superfamily hydrolase